MYLYSTHLGLKRGSHILALGPKYLLYGYMGHEALYKYLENNVKPENSYYPYHYFYNNCATRLLGIFEEILGDRIEFSDEDLAGEARTIRSLLHDYTYMVPFAQFGLDLVLGSSIDKPASPREVAFLPDYTKLAMDKAQYRGADGIWKPIVLQEVRPVNMPSRRDRPRTQSLLTPAQLMWLLFASASLLTVHQQKAPRVAALFDFLVFFSLGSVGMVMAVMWWGTDHVDARNNYNLLWALPSHAIFAFFFLKKSWTAKGQWYFRIVAIVTASVVILWRVWPQDLPDPAVPFALAGALRAARAGFAEVAKMCPDTFELSPLNSVIQESSLTCGTSMTT